MATSFLVVAGLASAAVARGATESHSHRPAVLLPEIVPAPSVAAALAGSAADAPASADTTPRAPAFATPNALPGPGSPRPSAPRAPASLRFGTRLGPGGQLFEVGSSFTLGQVVVWQAQLDGSLGEGEIRIQVVEHLADGRAFIHWDEAFIPRDPAAQRIVGGSNLALYAHDGAGTYEFRYVRVGT